MYRFQSEFPQFLHVSLLSSLRDARYEENGPPTGIQRNLLYDDQIRMTLAV